MLQRTVRVKGDCRYSLNSLLYRLRAVTLQFTAFYCKVCHLQTPCDAFMCARLQSLHHIVNISSVRPFIFLLDVLNNRVEEGVHKISQSYEGSNAHRFP